MLNFKLYPVLIKFYAIIAIVSIVLSCQKNSNNKTKTNNELDSLNAIKRKIEFVSPVSDRVYKIGEEIFLQVNSVDTLSTPDSIQFLVNGSWTGSVKTLADKLTWDTKEANAGTTYISALVFKNSAVEAQENINVKLYPAKPATLYTYKIISSHPHNTSAYTQGLVFNEGKMYEGTGLYEKSTLHEINIQTGEVLKEYTLPRDVFGEGITIQDDKIIQITWKEQVAFIYDKNTFQLLNKISYPIKEGWGITYDGNHLIMSDGSSIIYFLNKDDLTEYKRIEVCDENGPVLRLNELEYINGEIWANVYTTDTIVKINPKNGIVTGKIIFTGLLKPSDRKQDTDVLNGIAFDPKTNRIWVTGKNWPKLFQVVVQPREH